MLRRRVLSISKRPAGKLSYEAQLLSLGDTAMKARAENQLVTEQCYYESTEGISCLAGRSQFWITWDGKMLPCGMLPQIGYCVTPENFADVWKQINAKARTLPGCEACAKCEHRKICPTCAAARYCETGDTRCYTDYMCSYTKAYTKELYKHLCQDHE